jgi:hypothetical protein
MKDPPPGRIDLGLDPPLLLNTNAFAVGERYTLGMHGPDEHAPRPVRVTDIEVIHASGVRIVGVGVLDTARQGSGIGLVPGWPPEGYTVDAVDQATYEDDWHVLVQTVVGLEVTKLPAGLRGVQVSWVDGTGAEQTKVFDITAVTCAGASCVDEQTYATLEELGLYQPTSP